jgi:hypothetical protein
MTTTNKISIFEGTNKYILITIAGFVTMPEQLK